MLSSVHFSGDSMHKKRFFALSVCGWLLLFLGLIIVGLRDTAFDPELYHKLQSEAGILDYAGISDEDLLHLDVNLANYLSGKYENPNLEIEVFGRMQPAFNEKELIHLADCRRLLIPASNMWINIAAAVLGVSFVLAGEKKLRMRQNIACAWIASALILLPIATLGVWAAADFNSAFNFFHQILFTNDLWLLDPATDLLIRICPASMFAHMGLRIALYAAAVLIGIPVLLSLGSNLSKRKRK